MKASSFWKFSAGLVALVSAGVTRASPERRSFDYAAHLGNLSPYQKAPVPSGIREALPDDCRVEQVMLVSAAACILSAPCACFSALKCTPRVL